MTTRDARIRELRYMDGLSASRVAGMVGCSATTVLRCAPGRPGKVSNARLRGLYLASGKTPLDVARALGWMGSKGADGARVRRTLGLLPDVNGRGHRTLRTMIDAETAAQVADAIGVAAWEVLPEEDAA